MTEKGEPKLCLLETALASNGVDSDASLEASKAIGGWMDEADVVNGKLIIDCKRCNTLFAIEEPGEGDGALPVTLENDRKCEDITVMQSDKAGDWQLNINIRRLRQRDAIEA